MLLFLAAALTLAPPSPAEAPPAPAVEARPLAGIVTDGTVSLAGHAFYTSFCAYWQDKPMNELFALAVREQRSARRGNQVVVEYAGRVLFRSTLPPAGPHLAALGEQAVEISYETAVNAEVGRLLFSQDELAPDEF